MKKTYEKSHLVLTNDGKKKKEELSAAITSVFRANPKEEFILVDTKRVELEKIEKKLPQLSERIKEASEVGPLLQQTLDEIQERAKDETMTPEVCIVIAEYGDVHEQRPECDGLVDEILAQDYCGIRLILATQRANEMKVFLNRLNPRKRKA